MPLFAKKESEVEELIKAHFAKVGETLDKFNKFIYAYLEKNPDYPSLSYAVHCAEHEADIIRHKIELKLYEGAFLPIYREDYINLIELIDKIANRCEDTSDIMTLTHPEIPDFIRQNIIEMVNATLITFEVTKEGFEIFMKDIKNVFGYSEKISSKEQLVDKIEWHTLSNLFESELELSKKLLLKEVIQSLGKISNRMEDVGNQFELIAIKRKF